MSQNQFVSHRLPFTRSSGPRSEETTLLGLDGRPIVVEAPESGTVTADQTDPGGAAAAIGQAASLIYEPYYGLKEKPFSLLADPKFLYKSRSHAPAFDDLLAAIRRREGLIVLTGDIGTGKTTLCRAVLEHLDRKTFTTFVPDPFLSRKDLLKMLLVDFGVMSVKDLKMGRLNGASRADLSYPLCEFLLSLRPLQAFAVVIIDEAQNLSLPLLEEIRILSDLEDHGKLLQVVLIGQPELRSHLKLSQMRQVDQRVSVRCELKPLGRDAVPGYVMHRLDVAGGGNDRIEFSGAALDVVYQGSGGVPRLINLICDRALQRGHILRTAKIEPEIIWSALADLDLPVSPASDTPELSAATPRGLFQKATQTATSSSEMGLSALLDIPPLTSPQPSQPATHVQHTEPLSLDTFNAEPVEALGINRPESSPAGGRGRSRRVWLAGAALVLAVLAGVIGVKVSLGYLQELRQFAESVVDVPPPPPPLFKAPGLEARVLLDAAHVTNLPERASAEDSNTPAAANAQPYVIQVASFESPRRAEVLVKDLVDAGYRAYQTELDLAAGGRLHRVLVGRYGALQEAESDLEKIQQIPGYADARILDIPAPRRLP